MDNSGTPKLLRKFYLLVLFSASVLFFSCGSDSVTNPNSPAGTILYTWDSVSVWIQPSGHGTSSDSVTFSTSQTGSVEVIWTLQSNADTAFCKPHWGFYTNATPSIPLVNITGPVDVRDSTNLNLSSSGSTYFSFAAGLTVTNNPVPYYVRVKNIKIRKL